MAAMLRIDCGGGLRAELRGQVGQSGEISWWLGMGWTRGGMVNAGYIERRLDLKNCMAIFSWILKFYLI